MVKAIQYLHQHLLSQSPIVRPALIPMATQESQPGIESFFDSHSAAHGAYKLPSNLAGKMLLQTPQSANTLTIEIPRKTETFLKRKRETSVESESEKSIKSESKMCDRSSTPCKLSMQDWLLGSPKITIVHKFWTDPKYPQRVNMSHESVVHESFPRDLAMTALPKGDASIELVREREGYRGEVLVLRYTETELKTKSLQDLFFWLLQSAKNHSINRPDFIQGKPITRLGDLREACRKLKLEAMGRACDRKEDSWWPKGSGREATAEPEPQQQAQSWYIDAATRQVVYNNPRRETTDRYQTLRSTGSGNDNICEYCKEIWYNSGAQRISPSPPSRAKLTVLSSSRRRR